MVVAMLMVGLRPNALAPAVANVPVREEAEVADPVAELFRLVSRCGASLSERESLQIAEAILQESERYGYDPLFVVAMMEVESNCSPSARGLDGVVGLFQLKPSTARAMARACKLPWRGESTLTHPVANLKLGLRYLWDLEQRYKDSFRAVAAFNLGPVRVDQMGRHQARKVRYVRRIVSRYESLRADSRAGRT